MYYLATTALGQHPLPPLGSCNMGRINLLIPLTGLAVLPYSTAVILCQRHGQLGDRPKAFPAFVFWILIANLFHQAIHIFQFFKCRPVLILAPPAGSRCQPDSEGLSKIIIRVLLSIGSSISITVDMPDKPSTSWIRIKDFAIRL